MSKLSSQTVAYFQEKQIEMEENCARHKTLPQILERCVGPRTILNFLLSKNYLTLHSSVSELLLHEIAKLKLIAIFSGINLN